MSRRRPLQCPLGPVRGGVGIAEHHEVAFVNVDTPQRHLTRDRSLPLGKCSALLGPYWCASRARLPVIIRSGIERLAGKLHSGNLRRCRSLRRGRGSQRSQS